MSTRLAGADVKVPVLLDTDIGSDIDDALALAYLLRQPRCELLGVTTVTGEAHRRAALADALCHAAGRPDIPIHAGAEKPLLVPVRQERAGHAKALDGAQCSHREFAPGRNTAVGFLRDTIRARPGEVTLLTIGPLTNIALLFALAPEIPGLLKELVVMGGRYYSRSPEGFIVEWNILCDPHAAAIVYRAPVARIRLIGLDVTDRCRLDAARVRARLTGMGAAAGPLAPVRAMLDAWASPAGAETVIFHDPLAAALIFAPDLCDYAQCQINIDLISQATPGQTVHVYQTDHKPHRVAATVNPEAFFDHYFAVLDADDAGGRGGGGGGGTAGERREA